MGIIEIEAKLRQIERRKINHIKTDVPFYLEIQQPGNEERLKRIEEMQRHAMVMRVEKKNPSLKGQEAELFAEFFTEFLNGETKSINDFMTKKGYINETGYCGIRFGDKNASQKESI